MSEEAEVRNHSAAAAAGPEGERREILVPGGHGTAFVARAGQLVEIVDVEGQQVADFIAFAARNRTEWLEPWGIAEWQIPDPFNFFQNAPIHPDRTFGNEIPAGKHSRPPFMVPLG